MTKAIIWLCDYSAGQKHAVARKVWGYTENGIGLHKVGSLWRASHLETGLAISPLMPTRAEALREGKKTLARPDAPDMIERFKASKTYAEYSASQYAQSVTYKF